MTAKTETRFPLFYRQPELLTAAQHADLRLRPGGYGFARDANAIPLTLIEFGAAMRHYPVVFAAGDNYPVAILGLDRRNGFVGGEAWAPRLLCARLCASLSVRLRRPVAGQLRPGDRPGDAATLAGGDEGAALFSDGKPTDMVDNIMAFCRDFHGAHIQTDAFVEALLAQDLLVDQHADARLDPGQALMLRGFRIVDRAKFDALPDALVLEWHRKGWLALIHFHFLSLDRFADLLARAEGTAVSAEAVTETEDA